MNRKEIKVIIKIGVVVFAFAFLFVFIGNTTGTSASDLAIKSLNIFLEFFK